MKEEYVFPVAFESSIRHPGNAQHYPGRDPFFVPRKRFPLREKHVKKTYKLRIAYDGTAYQGWQVQPNGPTVAGTLERTFTDTFGHALSMVGASRTDSGVHALDQVARVRTDLAIAPDKLQHAWNNALPDDIVITQLDEAPPKFHPHHDLAYKEYEYTLFLERPLPLTTRFGWWPSLYAPQFSLATFEHALQHFIGTHDFTAFSRDEPGRNPVRAIDAISVTHDTNAQAVRVIIRGKGFLRFQIRRMIGAAVMAASSTDVTSETIAHLLANPQETSHALLKAAAQGLCLRAIVYTKE